MRSDRREIGPEDSRRFRREVALIAEDRTESPSLAVAAVRTLASLIAVGVEKGQISESAVEPDFASFIAIAGDTGRAAEVRGSAIRAIGELQIDDGAVLVREILMNPIERDRPEIARNALIAISRLDGTGAVEPISDVMRVTKDQAIFGTAAYSLGQIKTVESMVELARNEDRFPDSASPDAALVEFEDVVLKVLRDPASEHLTYAIGATRHLWRQGQRDRYIPLLVGLLTTAPLDTRRDALERLIDAASRLEFEIEKRELESALKAIADQPTLADYAQRIRRRLSASVLVPNPYSGPMPMVPELQN